MTLRAVRALDCLYLPDQSAMNTGGAIAQSEGQFGADPHIFELHLGERHVRNNSSHTKR